MTCDRCGARNTATATWCTQCLAPLGVATTSDPTPAPEQPTVPLDAPVDPLPGVPMAPGSTTGERSFRTVGDEVEWRCPRCDTWNDLLVPTCSVCGHSLRNQLTSSSVASDPVQAARMRRALWVVAAVLCGTALIVIVLFIGATRSVG